MADRSFGLFEFLFGSFFRLLREAVGTFLGAFFWFIVFGIIFCGACTGIVMVGWYALKAWHASM